MGEMCSRCIMDSTVPGLRLDRAGVCHLCHVHDRLAAAPARITPLVDRIKADGRGRPFDCVVPVSGGGDSCFALHTAVRLGLRPVVYHLDNGWVSDVARHNIAAVAGKLGVPVRTVAYPWEDLRGAYTAALRASIPEVCLPCLVAVWSVAYRGAALEGVRHVLHGSSPLTEGIAPLRWSFVDGRYLENVVARHGTPGARCVVDDVNRLGLVQMAWDTAVRRIRVHMLPLYVPWDEDDLRATLAREYGWVDGGKHADCVYSPFRNYVVFRKFGFDLRRLGPAAHIRSGRATRAAVLEQFAAHPPAEDPAATELCLARLGLSRPEYEQILEAPRRSFRDFPTSYPVVRALRPAIAAAVRVGALSRLVYDKYFEC